MSDLHKMPWDNLDSSTLLSTFTIYCMSLGPVSQDDDYFVNFHRFLSIVMVMEMNYVVIVTKGYGLYPLLECQSNF